MPSLIDDLRQRFPADFEEEETHSFVEASRGGRLFVQSSGLHALDSAIVSAFMDRHNAVPALTERFGTRARFCIDVDVKCVEMISAEDESVFLSTTFFAGCSALGLDVASEEMFVTAREPSLLENGSLRWGLHLFFGDNALVRPRQAIAVLTSIKEAVASFLAAGIELDESIYTGSVRMIFCPKPTANSKGDCSLDGAQGAPAMGKCSALPERVCVRPAACSCDSRVGARSLGKWTQLGSHDLTAAL